MLETRSTRVIPILIAFVTFCALMAIPATAQTGTDPDLTAPCCDPTRRWA